LSYLVHFQGPSAYGQSSSLPEWKEVSFHQLPWTPLHYGYSAKLDVLLFTPTRPNLLRIYSPVAGMDGVDRVACGAAGYVLAAGRI
jgi:hypothetical protein